MQPLILYSEPTLPPCPTLTPSSSTTTTLAFWPPNEGTSSLLPGPFQTLRRNLVNTICPFSLPRQTQICQLCLESWPNLRLRLDTAMEWRGNPTIVSGFLHEIVFRTPGTKLFLTYLKPKTWRSPFISFSSQFPLDFFLSCLLLWLLSRCGSVLSGLKLLEWPHLSPEGASWDEVLLLGAPQPKPLIPFFISCLYF